MTKKSILTEEDYYDYLLRVYFGRYENGKELEQCIRYAYLDMNRTLRGFGEHKQKEQIITQAEKTLFDRFEGIKNAKSLTQDDFDNWHRQTCEQLKDIFTSGGWTEFYVGQAQKWINMALKYVFVFRKLRPQYQHIYEFCHLPIDNIALEKLKGYDISLPSDVYAWSRVIKYDDYLSMQKTIRKALIDKILLDWEFKDWTE